MAINYPEYVNNQPPVITLREYDDADWAPSTCLDSRPEGYVVVLMEQPEQVIARIHGDDNKTLDTIFKSAKDQHARQEAEKQQQ
ncbi:uncharacterized protein LODBEIA_P25760 [Lodderomyces beijingensis]|uniref:Uncharacterized protein n=1 Tax=Lodderomyces beijingensis TaxID=1775926 RepID=A0ABP0ZJN4_9ASCO